uniref:Retroelement n=1 Tax=Oryza sativa subsp. japonica TaxID=39947 RepID=Q8S5F3_ORYSJ|nr:Putative retroelement [Oryza sativa Japonica Group]
MSGDKQTPPSTGKSTDPQNKLLNPTGSEVHEGNIVPLTIEKLSPEKKKDFDLMMKNAHEQFMKSFAETCRKVYQKYKVIKALTGEPGDKGDGFQEGVVEDLGPDGNEVQPQFNNFQDRIDYAVQHALINQSGVLVNTLTNMVKSLVDGTIAEYQATGPVYLPGGVFPNYSPLVIANQQGTSNMPPVQLTASISAPAPAAPSSAQRQMINPRLLTREQPQHGGQNVNRMTQEQPDQSVVPQVIPEHLVDNIQPNFQNYQGGNLNYQYQPPSPHVQYQQGGSPQPQFARQSNQFEPMSQQVQGVPQQRPWADMIADVMREQFGLKPKDTGNLYRHPYPEWFERVPLPGRYKVPDFSKFSGWADLEKQFHSYFYSGIHEMKLFDLTAIRQRHDEPVQDYIQRFREMRNRCYSLALTDSQLADLAFQGLIAPIKEKFLSQEFESLSHLAQKVTLHEQRFAEAKKNFKKINHVCPYMYGSDDEEDPEVAAAEWVRSKKVVPCPWINSARIINKYQRKYDKQQERCYEEDDGGFDPHWDYDVFRFCWNEGMRLPSIEDCPGCSDIAESSSRSYNRSNRLRQTRVPVHQRLGPVNQVHNQDDDEGVMTQWCPSGIFTKNQKRRVKRLRNRERFQEVEQEINHRLKKAKPKQEWRVKSQVPTADEVEADRAKRLAKGKSVVTASVNMVFMLPAEFGAKQADVDEVEEASTRLILSPEQAVFEKPEGTENRHLKSLYINGYVNGKPMSKMMVDGGAAVNLMPYATFRKLGGNSEDLIKTNMVLKDFGGNPSENKGVLNVELTVDSKTVPTTFFVIDRKGSYSLLLGRDWIHANCCIPSTMHQSLIQWQGDKIEIVPADRSVNVASADLALWEMDECPIVIYNQLKMESPNYYFEGVVEGSNVYTKDTVDDLDDKQGQGFMSADDLEEIDIGPGDRPRPTFISKNLSPEFRTKLIELLKEYRDCFAWEYYEMPGLSRSIVEHRLPIKTGVRPYQQPPRRCKADMLEAVKAEVARLYDADFIRPCRYAEWVSNMVPVIKKNGKVRVCIDFRDLNKATLKDEYPMSVADQLVDAASGHKILNFMDGNAGYNQIFMVEEDIHKTAFRCPGAIGLFEWVVMTFGLKRAGATYQRAMNYIFHDLIGWLVEVYVDDVVVKSKEIENHIANLRKVFERTRKYGLKMNPTKCAFGVSARQFLGFLVHERGIEVTQRSINAIKKIQPPEDKKKLQELIGKLRHYPLFNECTMICKADVVKYMLPAPILKGIVGKWIFALTEFDLRYESPKVIKGQAIADFIVDHRDDSIGSVDIVPWTLFFDGSVCTHGCGIGLVIISPRGASFEFAYTIKPYATNNQAEYEAVLKGLQLLKEVEADAVEIMGDSLLVISQLAGQYECKNDTLMVYNEKCRELMDGFRLVTLKHVSREQNIEANDLAQGASGYKPMTKDIKVEIATISADDWRYDIFQYLQNPSQSTSRKLLYKALKYTLLDDELCYRTIDGVLLKCLSADQAKVAIGEFADIMGIKLLNSSPYYAQANGQAESSNKSLIKLIKRKISDYPRQWHTRLAEALWSYRMACHGSIQVPPYKLLYGHEAVLPWEVRIGLRRTELQNELTADEYYNLMADEREDLVQSRLKGLLSIITRW